MRTPQPCGSPSRGLALRIVAAELRERQVGDELAQLGGGVGGERGLQPVLVFIHREVALGQCLTQLVRGPFALAIAGSNRRGGRGGHGCLQQLDLGSDKF